MPNRGSLSLSTQSLPGEGAYNAVLVTAKDSADQSMSFFIRIAYGPNLVEGDDLVALAEAWAETRIEDRGFEPGIEERWLLTSHGWETLDN